MKIDIGDVLLTVLSVFAIIGAITLLTAVALLWKGAQ